MCQVEVGVVVGEIFMTVLGEMVGHGGGRGTHGGKGCYGGSLQILWMLHVGEMSTNKWSKIQPFLDRVIPLFQSHLTPSRELSIDEAMIAFQGRVGSHQYIRKKPEPWVIKAYILSEICTT